jgi:hypothetical protein
MVRRFPEEGRWPVEGVRGDGGVTARFRAYDEDRDLWLYFELDEEKWPARQVEISGEDGRPVTAASLVEVVRLRDHAGLAATRAYERRYGVLGDAPVDGWRAWPRAAEVTAEDFERTWAEARRVLGGPPDPPTRRPDGGAAGGR